MEKLSANSSPMTEQLEKKEEVYTFFFNAHAFFRCHLPAMTLVSYNYIALYY